MSSNQSNSVPSHVVRRQARELEEQRILGLAPLAVDAVTGSSISPHVPSMLTTAPWYRKDLQRSEAGDREGNMTIAHHVEGSDLAGTRDTVIQEAPQVVYERVASDPTSSGGRLLPRHQPGACTNCGATTHKAANCLRPKRKVGSVFTGANEGGGLVAKVTAGPTTAASLLLGSSKLSFEQKRDAWSRHNSGAYEKAWSAHEKRIGEREATEGPGMKAAPRSEGKSLFDARTAAEGLKVSTQDLLSLPKYLENLEDDTFYDPRTKSMRGNPNALKKSDPSAAATVFKGDNAVLHRSGYYEYLDQQGKYLSGEITDFVELGSEEVSRKRAVDAHSSALVDALLEGNELGGSSDAKEGNVESELKVATDALYGALPQLDLALPAPGPAGPLRDDEGQDEDEEYSPL